MQAFNDKIAVITGGGSGIGRELAIALAEQGCHLALWDVDRASVEASAQRCVARNSTVRISTHLCDVAVEEQVLALEAHLVNTNSINGFWASLGPGVAHTAYNAAKFVVKGFSEAVVCDLRLHTPHVKISVVMPGHIGTGIAENTSRLLGRPDPADLSSGQLARVRATMVARGALAHLGRRRCA